MDQERDVGGMDLSSELAPSDTREAEPGRGERSEPLVITFVLIAIITLITWPITALAPSLSIDDSWAAGLHQAAHYGIAHGSGIDFTYGPLGFLDVPRLFYSGTATAAILYTVAVHATLVAVIFFATRRRSGLLLATAISLTVATVALVEPAEVVPLVYFAACLACLRSTQSERRLRTVVFVGTFLGAFQLLVKFNTGLLVFALAAALILAIPRRRLATLSIHVVGFVACLIGLWVVASQSIGAFMTWIKNSVEIAAGYTSAMATESRPWEYGIATAAGVGIALLLRASRSRMDMRARHAIYALLLTLLFAKWKHGFVRHDVHSVGFFFAVVVVAITLMWFSARLSPPIVVATLLMIAVEFVMPPGSQAKLVRPTAFIKQIGIMTNTHRREAFITASRQAIVRAASIDKQTLSLLAGSTVHIDPHQALIPWAYGLDWLPAPIFQTYSAYTPALDSFNARMLAGPNAPERILRVGRKAIDGRDRMFESPDYILSLLCHYEELSATKIYEVVARTADRCGPERRLSHRNDANSFLSVPRASLHEIVIMRIQMKSWLLEQVRSILFKPSSPPRIELRDAKGTQTFRLVEATAGDALVMCVPASAGFNRAFVRTACPVSIRLIERQNWSVSFSAISIR